MDLRWVTKSQVNDWVKRHDEAVVVRDAGGDYWRRDSNGWTGLKGAHGSIPDGHVEVPVDDVLVAPSDDGGGPAAGEGQPLLKAFPAAIKAQKDAYATGRRSSHVAQDTARDSVLLDRDGAVWTVGLASGDWYRYHKKKWHKEDPPDPGRFVRIRDGRHACHACGTVLEDVDACPECGAEVAPLLEELDDGVTDGLVDFLNHCPQPQVPEPITSPWKPPKQ